MRRAGTAEVKVAVADFAPIRACGEPHPFTEMWLPRPVSCGYPDYGAPPPPQEPAAAIQTPRRHVRHDSGPMPGDTRPRFSPVVGFVCAADEPVVQVGSGFRRQPVDEPDDFGQGVFPVGDGQAFVVFVQRYRPTMLRLAAGYLPNQPVAEEVVQDTWVDFLRGLSSFEGRSSVRTWLFPILVVGDGLACGMLEITEANRRVLLQPAAPAASLRTTSHRRCKPESRTGLAHSAARHDLPVQVRPSLVAAPGVGRCRTTRLGLQTSQLARELLRGSRRAREAGRTSAWRPRSPLRPRRP
ncbi:MAG TPA: sigma factor [Streptosporangiaceae bacterium]